MRIHYSQCWEDPATLVQALAVGPEDDVVSIASGGDNTFALLLGLPRSVAAVDVNPAQLCLVELKARAIERLDYGDFTGFVGARPCGDRIALYSRVRPALSWTARRYWDGRARALRKGIIHCGTFERFLALFRRAILPLAHTRRDIEDLLSCPDLDAQRRFYEGAWDNRRWQGLFRLFFGRLFLGRLGRAPGAYRHVAAAGLSEELLRRTVRGLTEVPVRGNFFVEHMLTGAYRSLDAAPPYLARDNFLLLKEHVGRIHLVRSGIREYLGGLPPDSVSKFNLSDVFEYMDGDDCRATLACAARSAREGARMAYWSLFVRRPLPDGLPFVSMDLEAGRLRKGDRTFFYGGFTLAEVVRGGMGRQDEQPGPSA